MGWHLIGANPLPEPMLICCQLDPKDKTWLKILIKKIDKGILHEDVFEIVISKMPAISFWPECV